MRFLILGRSVGNLKKAPSRRPGTPASLLWSLETTSHEPKINRAETLIAEIKTCFSLCCYYALFFSLKMPKIWALNRRNKKEDGLMII